MRAVIESRIVVGDCLDVLGTLPPGCARLVYTDPPFNTGRERRMTRLGTAQAGEGAGDRTGFGGRRYASVVRSVETYADAFEDYLGFLMPRLEAAVRCLAPDGSLFVHLDHREVHYVKVALDGMLGRRRFMNEIVWAYDFGGRPAKRWPCKHDTILWYAMDPARPVFRREAMDRIPYLAPGLVTPEKARRGKTPTDVWWQTIVPTAGRERTGYPTQKPVAIAERIVKVHSEPGDLVLDPFAGSGTVGEAARRHGRRYLLIDTSERAAAIMDERLRTPET